MIDIGRLAELVWDERRKRDEAFADTGLFGEPAWDILLDLAKHEARGKAVSVTSVSCGSGIPLTTTLRYVQLLTEAGMIEKVHDLTDRRRSFLRLTREGKRRLALYADNSFMLREN